MWLLVAPLLSSFTHRLYPPHPSCFQLLEILHTLFSLPGIILHSLPKVHYSLSFKPQFRHLLQEAFLDSPGTSFGVLQPPGSPSQPCACAFPILALTALGHHCLAGYNSTTGLGALSGQDQSWLSHHYVPHIVQQRSGTEQALNKYSVDETISPEILRCF